MKNYLVTVTNGIEKTILIIEKDGKWVTDLDSAVKMAESKINSAWKIVKAVPAFAEIVVREKEAEKVKTDITISDLKENDKIWKIKVTKGTKAMPEGEYQLYVRSYKYIQSISYTKAFELLQKGKAEIINA